MTTPTEYRQFALDCLRWADEAADASQRAVLLEIARQWMLTASRLPGVVNDSADFDALRRRLD